MAANRTRLIVKTAVLTLGLAAGAGVLGALVVLRAGWYDVAASTPHLQPVHTLLEAGMQHSVRHHARDVRVPALGAPAQVARGAALYRAHCVQCHGAPGVAQGAIGQGMQPLPGPLVDAARRWQPRELYWITRHGIKMSGMPAWEFRLASDELWSLVAFMGTLPTLSAHGYAALTGTERGPTERGPTTPAPVLAARAPGVPLQGDRARGRAALAQYACRACHMIPGVTGPETHVGRSLDKLAERPFIAGALPNNQENLVRWIRDPRAVDPHTAMPAMGVSERDARDMSAYLLAPD